MSRSARDGDHFVVGMSLAEIFLLLVFTVLLIGADREQRDGPIENERLRQENAKLSADNNKLSREVEILNAKVADQRAIIDVLASMAGAPIEKPADIAFAINALKRGARACFRTNTLVLVSATGGHLTLRSMIDLPAPGLGSLTHPFAVHTGELFASPVAVSAFLRAVRGYSGDRRNNCRFDYRLEYETAGDYLLARDSLERFMYPERIVRVSN